MILYLDTSALVKLYLNEPFKSDVLSAVKKSEVVASHLISFVEAFSAFARLQRENKFSQQDHETVKKIFAADWADYLQVENSQLIIQQAANFAEAFGLRAYDAMHLAAAHFLLKQNQQVLFACFDQKLNRAAKVLGFILLDIF